jgi:hypothetical protein
MRNQAEGRPFLSRAGVGMFLVLEKLHHTMWKNPVQKEKKPLDRGHQAVTYQVQQHLLLWRSIPSVWRLPYFFHQQ